MILSVYDFCQLCTDDHAEIRIFDMNSDVEDEVFFGEMRDAQFGEYSDCEVWSYDFVEGDLILNIDTSDDKEE